MKKLIILLFAFIPLMASAQAVQYGRTLEYNGRQAKSALPNVSIRLGDVETASDKAGNFKLVFRTLSNGDKVPSGRIEKPGYVIFNKQAYDEWRICSDGKPFNIVLCREESFKSSVATYYNIGMNSYKRQYEKELRQAEGLKNNLTAYRSKLKEINDRYINSLKQLDKYADLFARIDESEMNEAEDQAITLVKQGKPDEAIKMLDGLTLEEKLKATDNKLSTTKKLQSDAKNDIDSTISTAKTLINVYTLKGGKESFEQSCSLYEQMANADTANFNNVYDCAYFLHNQNKFSAAEKYYKMLLNIACPEVDRAMVLNNLGNLYYKTNCYSESLKLYQEAQAVMQKLASGNPEAYESNLAILLNNLGNLYTATNGYSESEKAHQEALAIRRRLSARNPEVYESYLASSLNNIGNLYYATHRYSESEKSYQEAQAIYQRLSIRNQETYEPDKAILLNNLGNLYSATHRNSESEKSYKEALAIYHRLETINPEAYGPNQALVSENLNSLDSTQKKVLGNSEIWRR